MVNDVVCPNCGNGNILREWCECSNCGLLLTPSRIRSLMDREYVYSEALDTEIELLSLFESRR